jgi:hypothetical protein
VPGYGEQFGTLQALWGYGAGHDGERYRVNLCESCFFAALAFLKQERRTQNLFSDEQPCEERPFGLVDRVTTLVIRSHIAEMRLLARQHRTQAMSARLLATMASPAIV